MDVREATKEDIGGIIELAPQIYRVNELPAEAKTILTGLMESEDYNVIVAVEDNKVLGTAFIFYINIFAHGRPFAFLEGMVVDEDSRGQGIGTKILEKTIEVAKARNSYKIILTSGFAREESHKLYEKLGFTKWGYEFRMDL